jgi:hypothetical protein
MENSNASPSAFVYYIQCSPNYFQESSRGSSCSKSITISQRCAYMTLNTNFVLIMTIALSPAGIQLLD